MVELETKFQILKIPNCKRLVLTKHNNNEIYTWYLWQTNIFQGVRYTALESEVDYEKIKEILEMYFGARTSQN